VTDRLACPTCGTTSHRKHDTATGVCLSVKSCRERRCARRERADRQRFAGLRWTQCMGAIRGRTSTRFCGLGTGHEGPHLFGTREWT